MSSLEVHDRGLHDLIAPAAPIERIAGGLTFTEGPVWRGGELLFSDIPRDRIMKWHPRGGVSVYREPSNNANGLAFDDKWRLLACEHGARRVSREEDWLCFSLSQRERAGVRENAPDCRRCG